MRIVPVGSSGIILGYFWFLKMMRGLFGDTLNILDCSNEAKSCWQHQIETTYMRKYHGNSLICLASHLIKPKIGRSKNCTVTNLSCSSIYQGGSSGMPAVLATILMSAISSRVLIVLVNVKYNTLIT